MSCSICILNDGLVYTSMPPKYKCTIDGELHTAVHTCNPYERGSLNAINRYNEELKSGICEFTDEQLEYLDEIAEKLKEQFK